MDHVFWYLETFCYFIVIGIIIHHSSSVVPNYALKKKTQIIKWKNDEISQIRVIQSRNKLSSFIFLIVQPEYYILYQEYIEEDWKHYHFSLLLDFIDHSENAEFFIFHIQWERKH